MAPLSGHFALGGWRRIAGGARMVMSKAIAAELPK
jgi:hypothetical protein